MTEWRPIRDDINLTRDADYVRIFQRHPDDPPFPPGTTAQIRITRSNKVTDPSLAEWPAADVTSDAISFWVQSEQTNAVPIPAAWRLMVIYPAAMEGAETQDWCWYIGRVNREQ